MLQIVPRDCVVWTLTRREKNICVLSLLNFSTMHMHNIYSFYALVSHLWFSLASTAALHEVPMTQLLQLLLLAWQIHWVKGGSSGSTPFPGFVLTQTAVAALLQPAALQAAFPLLTPGCVSPWARACAVALSKGHFWKGFADSSLCSLLIPLLLKSHVSSPRNY